MLTAAIAVALTAFVITTWLLTIASHAAPGTDQATARLDAVRTGLAAGAGAGAAVGLMLAFRRQHHQEIATLLTDLDATERRITELYTKAVEQLGNDKAPVRLGGLYALERLAQDNPAQRSTIVNVICAYLRWGAPAAPARKTTPTAIENAAEPTAKTNITTPAADDTWQQERQVRLAAQRILSEHLRQRAAAQQPADSSHTRFWPGMRLDLAGATLIDFSLVHSVVTDAEFRGAIFSGGAGFHGATFNGDAGFDGVTFSGGGWFEKVNFNGYAEFSEAIFSAEARFGGATFTSYAGFRGAIFSGGAGFGGATFSGDARFGGATFSGDAGFSEATFSGDAGFDAATFSGEARFAGTTFNSYAGFVEATFSGGAGFAGATFSGDAQFGGAIFRDPDAVGFTHALVCSSDGNHIWPTGWHLGDDGTGGLTVVRANDSSNS